MESTGNRKTICILVNHPLLDDTRSQPAWNLAEALKTAYPDLDIKILGSHAPLPDQEITERNLLVRPPENTAAFVVLGDSGYAPGLLVDIFHLHAKLRTTPVFLSSDDKLYAPGFSRPDINWKPVSTYVSVGHGVGLDVYIPGGVFTPHKDKKRYTRMPDELCRRFIVDIGNCLFPLAPAPAIIAARRQQLITAR